ncbi:MAG TPA: glycosyltransferase family 2 protein, partial [Acidobacteriaceae bacterium]|nr:glycosyltransferase family 2 protein [Acidobacteriaceae bacterium]
LPIELSIVMPCLNEAETLASCICKAKDYLERSGVAGEIVIGDNGSTDGSQAIALRNGARVVSIPLKGYGAALYGASLAARGPYIVMADSDDSYDFSNLDPFLTKLREGYDLVMGNRFKGGIRAGAMPWKNRYIGNPILSAIGRVFFHCPADDFHCGIRGYSRDAFLRMDLHTTGMEFASEMVIKATMMRMKICEVPTTLSPDGRSRPPHLRPYRDGWRHLRFMLLFSPNWLFLYPGLILVLIGLAGTVFLSFGQIHIRHLRFSIDTLIYCAFMIITGFQSVLFAVLSRVYAIQERLYPPGRLYNRLFRHIDLERGLIAGILLVLGGLGAAAYAVLEWRRHSFGPLNIEHISRIVIPSGLSITLGMEAILFSFFLSTLGMNVRQHSSVPAAEYADSEVQAIS